MATTAQITETNVTLRLSERARTKLAEQAANSGTDLSAVASDLIEQAITRPSIAEIMAPVRKQIAKSGMTDEQLDDLLRGEIESHRRERKPTSV
jgi:hypothetical protein